MNTFIFITQSENGNIQWFPYHAESLEKARLMYDLDSEELEESESPDIVLTLTIEGTPIIEET